MQVNSGRLYIQSMNISFVNYSAYVVIYLKFRDLSLPFAKLKTKKIRKCNHWTIPSPTDKWTDAIKLIYHSTARMLSLFKSQDSSYDWKVQPVKNTIRLTKCSFFQFQSFLMPVYALVQLSFATLPYTAQQPDLLEQYWMRLLKFR